MLFGPFDVRYKKKKSEKEKKREMKERKEEEEKAAERLDGVRAGETLRGKAKVSSWRY